MNLACKHALLRRDVAHLVFPDQVQTQPAPDDAAAALRRVASTPLGITPPEESLDERARAPARRAAAGDHRRARRALRRAGADRVRRAAGRAGHHHLQGQGPDRRRPSARGRRARPSRDAGRELVHERGRRAARRSAPRSPPTPASTPGKPIIQIDIDPLQLGKFHAVEVPVWGEVGDDARAAGDARWALWRLSTSGRSWPSAGRCGGRRRPIARTTTAGAVSPARRCSPPSRVAHGASLIEVVSDPDLV